MVADNLMSRSAVIALGVASFVQSHAGKKAGGRVWDLILGEVL
jgi:hypothetical protein